MEPYGPFHNDTVCHIIITYSHMQFVFLLQNGYIAVTFTNGRECCINSSCQSASCL